MADSSKISQVSRMLQVPVPTIRRWTREFAEGLSPSARGLNGADRQFLLEDIAFLRRVKIAMGKAEVTYDEARQQLGLSPSASSGGSPEALGPPSEEERQRVARYVRAIVEEVVAPHVRQIQKLETELAHQSQELNRLRALLEEGAEDSAGAGKLSRKGFPWAR